MTAAMDVSTALTRPDVIDCRQRAAAVWPDRRRGRINSASNPAYRNARDAGGGRATAEDRFPRHETGYAKRHVGTGYGPRRKANAIGWPRWIDDLPILSRRPASDFLQRGANA